MIFIDTAGFLAIENRRDVHHERALAFRDASLGDGQIFVTSDYVLDESHTLIRLRAGHAVAVQFGEDVRASRVLRVEHVTPEIVEAAWRIFKAFADKEFR
jgi:predicted nucleic acid-binding protein